MTAHVVRLHPAIAEHCWEPASDHRITVTLPECPAWCEVSAQEHEAEAWSRISGWYGHHRRVTLGDFASIYVCSIQLFEEQIEPGQEAQAADELTPSIWASGTDTGDGMTAAQARELAAALQEVASQVS
jgi:hypothetical protein